METIVNAQDPLVDFHPHLWRPDDGDSWFDRIDAAGIVALDFETAGRGKSKYAALDMRTAYAVGVAASFREVGEDGKDRVLSVYFALRHELSDVNHPDPEYVLNRLFRGPQKLRIFHQARFDVGIARVEKVDPLWPWADTMVMSWLYDENLAKKLKLLGEHYLGWKPLQYASFGDLPFCVIPPEYGYKYACQDTHLTLLLYEYFRDRFDDYQTQLYERLEMQVGRILIDMEWAGINIDLPLLNEYRAVAKSRLINLETEIAETLNINNPNSTAQLVSGCRSRGVDLRSTAAEHLQIFLSTSPDIPPDVRQALTKLRAYRYIKNKILGTYLTSIEDAVHPDGKVHPQIHQWFVSEQDARVHGTVTGRFSTTDPTLQTWPKEHDDRDDVLKEVIPGMSIRKLATTPGPDYVYVCGDLSQVEVRVAASVAREEKLIGVFSAGTGDIHRLIASYIFNKPPEQISSSERQLGKKVVFTSLYFGGVAKIATSIWNEALKVLFHDRGIPVPGEAEARRAVEALARKVRNQFYMAFPGFNSYPDRIKQHLMARGEVRTRLGRSRRFPHFHPDDHRMVRQAGNFLIQSTAVDICKLAMVALQTKIEQGGWDARMVGQVHDEVMIIAHRKDADAVAKALYDSFKEQEWVLDPVVSLDSEVAVGYSWGSMVKYKMGQSTLDEILPRPTSDYDAASVRATLMEVIKEATSCVQCPVFEKFGWKKVFYEGKISEPIDLVIVGANPGSTEVKMGQPFVGDSGALLRDELLKVGIDPSSRVLIVNALLCSSPNTQGLGQPEIGRCSPFLDRVLSAVKPKAVLCLGSIAHRAVCKTNKSSIDPGWTEGPFPFKVYTTWHPAYLLRSRGFLPQYRTHLAEVAAALGKTPSRPAPSLT